MDLNKEERWKVLAAKASVEQDPEKLIELTREISDLLDPDRKKISQPAKLDGAA